MKYRHKLTLFLVVSKSGTHDGSCPVQPHAGMSSYGPPAGKWRTCSRFMEQTRESIDSQTAVYTSLLNYLTYSPDIEEIIKEKNMDNYTAYEQYTKVADPLLSVPKSYHEPIKQIQLFADSIQVEHEYTLVPLRKNPAGVVEQKH